VFLLDCSASMVQSGALGVAKGVLLALMAHAYRLRHEVCLIVFGGDGARMQVSPQRASWTNDDWVELLPGGGGTPLQAALDMANTQMHGERFAHHALWLLSDGRVHGWPRAPAGAQGLRVLDFEMGAAHRRLGRARALARHWQAEYIVPSAQ
jgi:magnesium chelatase subunit ChlD-like protein